MINNVVLVSGVQQSDSVIHKHVSILSQILLPFRLLQNIQQMLIHKLFIKSAKVHVKLNHN